MDKTGQVQNLAHEAYGHAFFYELRQQGESVSPFHQYKSEVVGEEWVDYLGTTVVVNGRVDANKRLAKQIGLVTEQAKRNFNSRKK